MTMRDANGRFISPKKVTPPVINVQVWRDKLYANTDKSVLVGIMTEEEFSKLQYETGGSYITNSITI